MWFSETQFKDFVDVLKLAIDFIISNIKNLFFQITSSPLLSFVVFFGVALVLVYMVWEFIVWASDIRFSKDNIATLTDTALKRHRMELKRAERERNAEFKRAELIKEKKIKEYEYQMNLETAKEFFKNNPSRMSVTIGRDRFLRDNFAEIDYQKAGIIHAQNIRNELKKNSTSPYPKKYPASRKYNKALDISVDDDE